MFKFLKNIMNNEDSIITNDINLVHRILKTDIKKDPNHQEDEIIFGCGCFWGAEKCFWKLPGVVTTSVVMLEVKKIIQLIMKYVPA